MTTPWHSQDEVGTAVCPPEIPSQAETGLIPLSTEPPVVPVSPGPYFLPEVIASQNAVANAVLAINHEEKQTVTLPLSKGHKPYPSEVLLVPLSDSMSQEVSESVILIHDALTTPHIPSD